MLGCWYRYAGSCLIVLFSIALRGVVFCIGAEYADVVQVLVAVGW
jgi:NADH:ubiquinone oxidoreductase subunit 6 (subunit J)